MLLFSLSFSFSISTCISFSISTCISFSWEEVFSFFLFCSSSFRIILLSGFSSKLLLIFSFFCLSNSVSVWALILSFSCLELFFCSLILSKSINLILFIKSDNSSCSSLSSLLLFPILLILFLLPWPERLLSMFFINLLKSFFLSNSSTLLYIFLFSILSLKLSIFFGLSVRFFFSLIDCIIKSLSKKLWKSFSSLEYLLRYNLWLP